MKKKVKCWEVFECNEKECPVYEVKELKCWLISGTHCRKEIQGKFLEKMEMCINCVVFEASMDVGAMKDTLHIVDKQFKEFRSAIIGRDEYLEGISMELALGLSEVFEALNKVATGDPRVRISEVSENELIAKLKQTVNKTAEGIEAVVNQSHEFAIGLAEHFDVLHRVSKGNLNARISESSQDELLKALGKVTNQMIESVSREITERKKTEEVLREKVEREELILHSLPMAFYTAQTFDNFGRIWVSEQIDRISGFPSTQFVEDKHFWVSRLLPEDRERVLDEYKTIYPTGSIAIEYLWQCADGTYHWFYDQAVLIRDEQGNSKEVIGTWRDITERKQAEEEIRKLNEELEQKVIDRTAQLEASIIELEGFTYSVAHDLRAPFRHIIGFAELLKEGASQSLDEENRRYLDVISDSAKYLGRLQDDILDFIRIGRTKVSKQKVSLDNLVNEVIDAMVKETKGRDVVWRVDHLPEVDGDPNMLRDIFVNLLSNALKFTRPRPQAIIEIGCTSGDQGEVFYVRDNGVGFDMQYANKLFGVFHRLHSPDDFEGTGIGLANVRRIIERHSGRVWAKGKVDGGATFYFALPLREVR